jgi:hypothetical protein
MLAGAAVALGTMLGQPTRAVAAPAGCGVPPREPVPFGLPDPASRWSAAPGPVVTNVRVQVNGYTYEVAGWPESIRGMGYSPPVAGLTGEQRRARYQQDFGLMAAAGVNTLIGWDPAAFDGLMLDVAHDAGLGVALPFDVDFTQDVRDPATRATFMSAVLRWVDQYREHPALRIWAVGNEVLQRSVPPSWCSTAPSVEQDAWAAAWGDLLVQLADAIHDRDPYHPVLYREAEDAYTPWLAEALAARPAERPWLIYGINAYTPRLAEILGNWPAHHIPSPLLVSELAPLNAPFGARADAFREIWAVVRSFPAYVLGGSVYVWSTDGPEDVDRQFGLVDAFGTPVDDALATIADLFRADAAMTPAARRTLDPRALGALAARRTET